MIDYFEILETTKGDHLALHDGYKYRMYRINSVNLRTWVPMLE